MVRYPTQHPKLHSQSVQPLCSASHLSPVPLNCIFIRFHTHFIHHHHHHQLSLFRVSCRRRETIVVTRVSLSVSRRPMGAGDSLTMIFMPDVVRQFPVLHFAQLAAVQRQSTRQSRPARQRPSTASDRFQPTRTTWHVMVVSHRTSCTTSRYSRLMSVSILLLTPQGCR